MSSNEVTIHLRDGDTTSPTPSELDIVTTRLTSDTVPSKYIPVSTIIINIDSIELYDPLSLASLIPSLRKDGCGQITLQVSSNADVAPLHTSIMLAGLTPQSEKTDDGKISITSIYKPKSKRSSAAIKINSKNKITKKIQPAAVKLNLGDLTDEDDLIDEDDLLSSTPNGINAPEEVDMAERQKALDDCGGRKACDDCTCGRKEMEESGDGGTNTASASQINTSACGNCSKGDAFRCAGCPFLGKPAFKAGEEHLVLDLTDDL